MKSITIRLSDDDYDLVQKNLLGLSKQLGRRINKSDLIRHLLMQTKNKIDLFNLNYISLLDLHDSYIPKNRYKLKI